MPTIVHFDLPVDDLERAKKFYEKLFDWKFNQVPMPTPLLPYRDKRFEWEPRSRWRDGKKKIAFTEYYELHRCTLC